MRADWREPVQLNGVLQRYVIYASLAADDLGDLVYNSSYLFKYYELDNLTAGATYYIRIGVSSNNLHYNVSIWNIEKLFVCSGREYSSRKYHIKN